jgi:hypothetical protein
VNKGVKLVRTEHDCFLVAPSSASTITPRRQNPALCAFGGQGQRHQAPADQAQERGTHATGYHCQYRRHSHVFGIMFINMSACLTEAVASHDSKFAQPIIQNSFRYHCDPSRRGYLFQENHHTPGLLDPALLQHLSLDLDLPRVRRVSPLQDPARLAALLLFLHVRYAIGRTLVLVSHARAPRA